MKLGKYLKLGGRYWGKFGLVIGEVLEDRSVGTSSTRVCWVNILYPTYKFISDRRTRMVLSTDTYEELSLEEAAFWLLAE